MPVPERCVVQQVLTPAVRQREYAAAVAALNLPVSLDRQAQPAAGLAFGREDTHSRHAEQNRCRRAAVTPVHLVEAFASLCLVATDPRRPRPVPGSAAPHRRVVVTTPVAPDSSSNSEAAKHRLARCEAEAARDTALARLSILQAREIERWRPSGSLSGQTSSASARWSCPTC